MRTPFGPLKDLDLTSNDVAIAILSENKHRLIEGLIVESVFDQILSHLSSIKDESFMLPVETIIFVGNDGKKYAVIWAKEKTKGLGRYILALEKRFSIFLIEYDREKGFFGHKLENVRRYGDEQSLDDLLSPIAIHSYKPFAVSNEIRDENRQKQAIWGHILSYYNERMAADVLLPRLLINYGIQTRFKYVWNLDRMFLIDDQLWTLEIKHKYPFKNKNILHFGFPSGEASNLLLLHECGIQSIFSLIVKPKWDKEASPLYLINNMNDRNKAGILAHVFTKEALDLLNQQNARESDKDTSLTGGEGDIAKYKSIRATDFKKIGVLSDKPEGLCKTLLSVIKGNPQENVDDDYIYSLKI